VLLVEAVRLKWCVRCMCVVHVCGACVWCMCAVHVCIEMLT